MRREGERERTEEENRHWNEEHSCSILMMLPWAGTSMLASEDMLCRSRCGSEWVSQALHGVATCKIKRTFSIVGLPGRLGKALSSYKS